VKKAVLIAVLFLASCSYPTRWKDTSGQGRGEDVAVKDVKACDEETGFRDDASLSTDELIAQWRNVRVCMKAHGWVLVRADNGEPITFRND
jgi:hypothetical protein